MADNEKLLKRRSREIKGLHELATLLRGEESVDGIIQDIAKRIIPEHLQYPDRVFCEIEIDKKTYSNFTNVYSTNNFSFIAPVKINGVERGHLKVGYERGDETYLSVYEKRMIEIYAHEVALFLQNHELSGREKWMKETVEMTLEAYQDGILLVSKEGNIFRYNRKFLEIWGINEEVMKKEGPKKMMSVMKSKLENPVVSDDIFKTFMADEKGFTLELVFKTGKVFEVKGDFLPYSREERAYVWNFKEMTSYIQLKDECDKSKERIAQMENMLRAKMN